MSDGTRVRSTSWHHKWPPSRFLKSALCYSYDKVRQKHIIGYFHERIGWWASFSKYTCHSMSITANTDTRMQVGRPNKTVKGKGLCHACHSEVHMQTGKRTAVRSPVRRLRRLALRQQHQIHIKISNIKQPAPTARYLVPLQASGTHSCSSSTALKSTSVLSGSPLLST